MADHTRMTVHEYLLALVQRLPTDFEPYGQRKRENAGPDCSGDCRYWLPLDGPLRYDWGVCGNPFSPRRGLLTFEHQGCPDYSQASVGDDDYHVWSLVEMAKREKDAK